MTRKAAALHHRDRRARFLTGEKSLTMSADALRVHGAPYHAAPHRTAPPALCHPMLPGSTTPRLFADYHAPLVSPWGGVTMMTRADGGGTEDIVGCPYRAGPDDALVNGHAVLPVCDVDFSVQAQRRLPLRDAVTGVAG